MNKVQFKERVREFVSKCKRKIAGIGAAFAVGGATGVTSFAAEGDTAFSVSDITTVLNPIKEQFTFTNIATILAIVVGAAAVLTLGWFGVRKVISIIQKALKKGKVSV